MKFIAAILSSSGFGEKQRLLPELERIFGPIDFSGPPRQFTGTDYYEDEMGTDLHRRVVSFSGLGEPCGIVSKKLAASTVEALFEEQGCRRVNIDPGYIDYYKVVLASFKEGPQKVYLGEGVYADPVLLYQEGRFVPLPWSFPDFRDGVYSDELMAIRAIYKEERRSEFHL